MFFHYVWLTYVLIMYTNIITYRYIRVPTLNWKTLKTWNFYIYFSRPGKCLEFAQKVEKPRILAENLEKTFFKFGDSRITFQDVIYKAKSDLHFSHIYIINTNSDSKSNWYRISLLFPAKNLENTWIYFCHQRSVNPRYARLGN